MRWRGRWLLGVAAIHTLFALVVFREPLLQLVSRGLVNAVGHDPMSNAVTWFVLFGAAMAMLGQAVDAAEQRGQVPGSLGVSVLALTLVGVVLMPASGFWLLLPPGLSLVRASRSA